MKRLFLLAFVGLCCSISDPPEPPPVATMMLDPEITSYSYDTNPGGTQVFTLTISNTGDLVFDWTDVTASAWLSLATTTGTLEPGEYAEVDVTVDLSSLSDGLSAADIVIEWYGGAEKMARVVVYIDGGQAWIIVDGVNGDDDLGDGTVANPYKTIAAGLAAAGSADTILCLPATYQEQVALVEEVTLVGTGPQGCLVDAGTGPSVVADNTITAATSFSGFRVTGDNPVDGQGAGMTCEGSPVVTNCEFVYSRGSGDAAVLFKGDSAASVSGCVVSFCSEGYGIRCLESSSPIVSDCIISRNGLSGVMCGGNSAPVVEFCEIALNGGPGVYVLESAMVWIDANTIRDNVQGIALWGDTSAIITNNLILDSTGSSNVSGLGLASAPDANASAIITNNTVVANEEGIWWGSDGGWSLENNIIYYNSVAQATFASAIEPSPYGYNCIQGYQSGGVSNSGVSPWFVDKDGRDLRLMELSPCRNSGNNSAMSVPDHDRDSNSRPLGAAIDRGAYEYVE